MSWLYSQALVAASSAASSSAGELSAPSSGSPIPQAFSSPDRMMAFSRLSRFGMTFAPLTGTLGADVLTWCLADSLARTSASPERAQESTAAAPACGPTWRGSLAKFDPASCSWKTAQLSLLEDLAESLETWPRSGLMLRGECFPLLTLEHRTVESGSGLWPTPTSTLGSHGGLVTPSKAREGGTLIEAVSSRMWPTPTASDNRNRGTTQTPAIARRIEAGKQVMLTMSMDGPLNPTWVELLMNWPRNWTSLEPLGALDGKTAPLALPTESPRVLTDLNPLATDKCPSAPPPPGESLPATLHELDGRET